MIKIIDDTQNITVDFMNEANQRVQGQLLVYEVLGEACVLVDRERVWIPFSRLTRKSRDLILGTPAMVKNSTDIGILKDPKAVAILSLMVVIFYCLVQATL